MTVDEALEAMRARWTHPALDPRDVEEWIAVRFDGPSAAPTTAVLRTDNACRLFVLARPGAEWGAASRWCSRYVHAVGEVDEALDWILETIAREAARPTRKRKRRAAEAA